MTDEILYAVVFSSMLFLFLIAVIVIVFFVSSRNIAREKMTMSTALLKYEQELRKAEAEVSEHLLTHMSRELHDSVGQIHTAMKIQLENLKYDFPAIANSANDLETSIEDASQQIKSLSKTFNRDYIGVKGLVAAVELEITRLRNLRKFQIHFTKEILEMPLNKNQELMVFRIFQEITQNVLKHANAENFTVSLSATKEKFILKVNDDGVGFTTSNTTRVSENSGIRNMYNRAKLSNLQLQIISAPNKGCTIHLTNT